ncbi:MAG TPA: GNAT family N-acetyltransferase [Thermoanaerobaculia bacterium]|nr:GNAT family N-acetyltransferase [Thermoanaerobaculia bacterium]
MMDPEIQHEEGKRYYIQLGDKKAELTYSETGKTRDFRHTYVPEEQRGRKVAERLVRHALDDSMKNGYKFTPTCPYVERFVEKHPEYKKGLAS